MNNKYDLLLRVKDNDECYHNFNVNYQSDEHFQDMIYLLCQMDNLKIIKSWEIEDIK